MADTLKPNNIAYRAIVTAFYFNRFRRNFFKLSGKHVTGLLKKFKAQLIHIHKITDDSKPVIAKWS